MKALKTQITETRTENKTSEKSVQSLAATVAETKAKLEERESEYLAELNTVKTGIAEFKNEVKPLKAFVDKHGRR